MTAGERFKRWIDSLSELWKDRLRGWMASWLSFGLELILDILGKGMAKRYDAIIDKTAAEQNIPPEIVAQAKELWKGEGEWQAILGYSAGGAAVGSLIGSTIGPWLKMVEYSGLNIAETFRFDPGTIIGIWLRDKAKYEKLFADLRDQGWSEERIAVAKELAKIIPPLADMVRFADFSAFDPEVIAKWREFYDAPSWVLDPFALLGVTNEAPRDWGNKYWFSHYVQPGRYELGEMYRRGLLGKPLVGGEEIGQPGGPGEAEETIKLAYRTMAYSTFWQDRLLQLVRSIPTRVDVRRWWDMRTIDEARLRELYQAQGYFGKDLEDYVLWTKVYVAFPDLIARWKNGWITEDDVRSELTELGMPYDRVTEMIQSKKKAVEAGQVDEGKALTKTEIYKGVKAGTISRDQGIDLIMDLNYTLTQAEYLLDINVATLAGSPETYEEFKDITTKYKIAIGKEEKPMPEELKKAGEEVIRLTKEVESLQEAIKAEEAGLIEEEVLPAEATARRDELRVALHRAEAELARVKTEYEAKIAEWRHGA